MFQLPLKLLQDRRKFFEFPSAGQVAVNGAVGIAGEGAEQAIPQLRTPLADVSFPKAFYAMASRDFQLVAPRS
jgi:hypothetical protein